MPYFHSSLLFLKPGAVIAPGAWGARLLATGVSHRLYFRELELERARVRLNTGLPSRLNSAFAFIDAGDATRFAQRRAASEGAPFLLYEVEPVSGSIECRLPMRHMDSWSQLCMPEDVEPWADRYWKSAPYGGADTEVLVKDGITVVGLRARIT